MKDFYSLFVEYCTMLCRKDDYADKKKVKAHNTAAAKLEGILGELKQNDALQVLSELLEHDDDTVKLNAAACCLKASLYCDEATNILKKIARSSDDKALQFSAKMLLK